MPLFQNASSTLPVKADALISIPPGMYNNLFEGDIVFVSFEENALEKPIIIGKMYLGASFEGETPGGAGILDSLIVRSKAEVPASTTTYVFEQNKEKYIYLDTPKEVADYIKWLEELTKNYVNQLAVNFKCFEHWVKWHFQPEHIGVDDGDLGDSDYLTKYTTADTDDNNKCTVCTDCKNLKKDKQCRYISPKIEEIYTNN
jgi:hypothetical protein